MEPSTVASTDASVVVCTHSAARWEQLLDAVDSVRRQALDDGVRGQVGSGTFEIVVVVDHNPALLHHARTRLLGVRVLANAHAPGLSGARNTGSEQARGDVVVFLDDDAVAEPGWLAAHLDAFRDPSVVGTGGTIDADWEGSPPLWWPPEFDWVVGCTYEGWAGERAETIRNPIGANMAFRRPLVLQVGGFSDHLGRNGDGAAGCEETDLAIRLACCHPTGRIVAVPAARVRHIVPAERATFRYFTRRCIAEGRSKAVVARRVGTSAATAAERTYVRRTLPLAIARSLRRGRPARAAAVLAGLACTTAGFARSSVVR
jgi:GT2 family glycosyltransferase